MATVKSNWQLSAKKNNHPLVDVQEPNLMRDMFPYNEIPKNRI